MQARSRRSHPSIPGRGGIPACEEELAACEDDLGSCEEDLVDCEYNQVVLPGDGAGHGAPLAYEVCADGLTVADLNTRLLWERKVVGGPRTCLESLHGANSRCNWFDAAGPWIDAVNTQGGTGYAGFSDWRLPNVKELHSIVDYRQGIDPGFGPGPRGAVQPRYWSATISLPDRPPGSPGWHVDFASRTVNAEVSRLSSLLVRAVRNGSCSMR